MSRDYSFRGLRMDNSEWAYGYLNGWLTDNRQVYAIITPEEVFIVKPETVGQYTGQIDKNDVEIYAGEIIFNDDRKENAIVKYDEQNAMFICEYVETKDKFPLWESISNLYYSIGNIYQNQNPELISK